MTIIKMKTLFVDYSQSILPKSIVTWRHFGLGKLPVFLQLPY